MSDEPRKTGKVVGKWVLAALFITGGIGHFVATDVYLKIMPPYLPFPRALVLLSGVFEVVLGLLLLVPATSRFAAWGLIALLVAVFPANYFMFQHPERFSVSPAWLMLRLPLQGLLIYWAYIHTRPRDRRSPPGSRSGIMWLIAGLLAASARGRGAW